MFLADCPARLDAVKAAVGVRDAEAVRTAAHALKGVAGNLSAGAVVEAAAALEAMGHDGDLTAADEACRHLDVEVTRLLVELPLAGSREAICAP